MGQGKLCKSPVSGAEKSLMYLRIIHYHLDHAYSDLWLYAPLLLLFLTLL